MSSEFSNYQVSQLEITKLRLYAEKYLEYDKNSLEKKRKSELISELSAISSTNQEFKKILRQLKIKIRPSFFLVNLITSKDFSFSKKDNEVSELLKSNIENFNFTKSKGNKTPSPKNLTLESFRNIDNRFLEFDFSWHRIHWYWNQNIVYDSVYEIKFGYVIIDFKSKLAIIICQNQNEKKMLFNIFNEGFEFSFSTQQLTKPLLDLIGDFDSVLSAKYINQRIDNNKPNQMKFTDVELSRKSIAIETENDVFSKRMETFYRINLDGIENYGLGVTSHTGKLYIPKLTELSKVKDFGYDLLRKITDTVDDFIINKEYDEVFNTLALYDNDNIKKINPKKIRKLVEKLTIKIGNMILNNQETSSFSVSDLLAIDCVPRFFSFPTIELYDEQEDFFATWRYDDNNKLIKITNDGERKVYSISNKEPINLNKLVHPLTQNIIDIQDDLYSHLTFIPTIELNNIIKNCLIQAGTKLEKLFEIKEINFIIKNNQIILDNKSLFRQEFHIDIDPYEISNYISFINKNINQNLREEYIQEIFDLKELCENHSNQTCPYCHLDKKYICLRSLVNKFSNNSQLHIHQGIELSDGEGDLFINNQRNRYFMFAKLKNLSKKDIQEKGITQLTLKNPNGAILFSQVFDQIQKNSYEIVMILSPSSLSDNLLNALRTLCRLYDKKLLIIDYLILVKMLIKLKEDFIFDGIEIKDIYKNSGIGISKLS